MAEERLSKLIGILTLTTTVSLLLLASILASAHAAYGNTAQWQVGFSGNCRTPTTCGGTFGVLGWGEIGGSSGSTPAGTTRTTRGRPGPGYVPNALWETHKPT